MAFSFIEHTVRPQSPEQTLLILTYEIAKVVQCDEAGGGVGYNGHALTEMSDVISMLRYFCEQISAEFNALSSDSDSKSLVVSLGKVVQAWHYTNVFGSTLYHDKLIPSLEMLKGACVRYCHDKGWKFDDVALLGEEHFLERMQYIKESGVCQRVVTCSHKGQTCLHEPITCQEAFCNRCQIYKVHGGVSNADY